MIICGIDASTSCTGWSIFKDDKLITYGAIKPHGEDWRGRVMDLTMALSEIFKIHRPNIIYMEDVPMKKGSLTIEKLGAVQGVVLALCAAYKIGAQEEDPVKMYLADICTVPVNIAGLPAISTTCAYTKSGLPIGMSLVGKAFDEATILMAADRFERDFKRQEAAL